MKGKKKHFWFIHFTSDSNINGTQQSVLLDPLCLIRRHLGFTLMLKFKTAKNIKTKQTNKIKTQAQRTVFVLLSAVMEEDPDERLMLNMIRLRLVNEFNWSEI